MNTLVPVFREVAGFLLAASCAGCDLPGAVLCETCRAELGGAHVRRSSPAGLPLVAARVFAGPVARVIRALKEEGSTTLARPLGALLREVIRGLPAEPALVPVPTSRAAFRRRGYRVPELLIRRAGFASTPILRPGRAVADQRDLDRAQRAANVRGSITARGSRMPSSAIIVDDVITSGATVDEAARVLTTAGVRVIAGVAVASTPTFS